jgi:RNA polymerase sigma-70 factor (ECF subfamily)
MVAADAQWEKDIDRALARYADQVRRICFLYLKRREDVEDVFQDVFLKYLQRKTPFAGEQHEQAWLIRVAINSCKDVRRSFWRRQVVPLDENLAADMPPEHLGLLKAVLQLPVRERTAIYLHDYEGYTAQEIARVLKQRPNTVYSHLHRARKKLAKQWRGDRDEH